MTLAPHAAVLRGDDYHHAVALHHACRMLTDNRLDSISIEDARGGAFDDIVIRMRPATGLPHEYIQVKSSNYRDVVINETWLFTAKTRTGKSPLQRFHATWRALTATGEPFCLNLLSNRNYDHTDDLLRRIDNNTERIPVGILRSGPRSKAGKAIRRWADHLQISLDELREFLDTVCFQHGEPDASWMARCRPLMRDAGLRDDNDALAVGRTMIREWVTAGAGARTRDDIRAEVTVRGLLARSGTLTLAVHAIDRTTLADLPNITVDITDLYPDIHPFQRRQLRDPADWSTVVAPKLAAANTDLATFRSHRVHIVGAMRLALWFAVGRTLPDVGGWVLSLDQQNIEWCTNAERTTADIDVLLNEKNSTEGDLVVAIALRHDPTTEIRDYIEKSGLAVKTLLVLSTSTGPSPTSVPGPGWAADWASRSRDHIRAAVREANASTVHLFFAAPAGIAMFLGHQWNMIPTTTVYEHLDPGYAPTLILPG